MLTKNDLMQIKTIVKGEVEPIKKAVNSLDQKVNKLDQKLERAQTDISEILTEVIGHHDVLEKRVDRIEDHLDLPKLQ